MGTLQAFAPLSIDMYLPSMPLLERIFHATTAQVQTTLVTFFIGFALGQALYGPITDRFGRKPPLYFSLTLFVLSSAGCSVAPSIHLLSILRLLQALGACGGAVISRAMVRDLFPPSEIRKVFSMLILVLGVSPLLAPLIGSYLLVWFGWTSIFWTQAGLGALCLIAVHFRLRESMPRESARPLSSELILSGYRQLLSDRTFVGASLVCGFSSAGMFSYIASAPFVLIDLYKLPPQWFGWLFGAIATGMITASQINGRMSHRIPLRSVLRRANMTQCLAGALVLGAVLSEKGGIPGIFVPVFLYMFAAGFVFPNGSALAMIRHGKIAGSASALLGTIQFIIAAIAIIALGEIQSASALPMAIGIAACGFAAMSLNFLALKSHDETVPAHP